MIRWTFNDSSGGGDTYVFERNPREMTSPHRAHDTTSLACTVDRRTRAARAPLKPIEWSFTGDIRTRTHYEALQLWAKKDSCVHITDHLGRTFKVLILQFDVTEQRPSYHTEWRATYTMRTMLYGSVVTPRTVTGTPAAASVQATAAETVHGATAPASVSAIPGTLA